MFSFTSITVFSTLVLSISAIPTNKADNFREVQECPAGKSFIDNCNVCRCGVDGKSAACTMMACPPNDKIRIDNYKQGQKCPAGKSFYNDCNSCICGKDGVSAACTLKLCPSQIREQRSVPNFPHIDNFSEILECTPGQDFMDFCNYCACESDGKTAVCSLMACYDTDKPRLDNYVAGRKCPVGKTFYDKCNTCKCNNDGRSASCTLKACPDFE